MAYFAALQQALEKLDAKLSNKIDDLSTKVNKLVPLVLVVAQLPREGRHAPGGGVREHGTSCALNLTPISADNSQHDRKGMVVEGGETMLNSGTNLS
jgi:hypothetical protein